MAWPALTRRSVLLLSPAMFPQQATSVGHRRRHLALSGRGTLIAVALLWLTARAAEPELFQFHHDNILGTSLDLQVQAPDAAQAALAESTVLDEAYARQSIAAQAAD